MKKFTLQMDQLEIEMFLGLHAFEKEQAQRVRVSATIETEIEEYSNRGFFDYDGIADFIRGFRGRSIETQEELAGRIRDHILEDHRVKSAIVHTMKPDIYPDAKGVGVIVGAAGTEERPKVVVQLDEMAIEMFLGIHDHEKERAQRVLVSSTIVTNAFYDYDALADFIRSLSGTRIETQEELLERVHGFILDSDCVEDAIVHTRKPDIYKDADAIGIVFGSLPFPYGQVMSRAA